MDTTTLSHADLLALVAQQAQLIAELQAVIARLEQRIRDLEDGTSPPRRMPGHKPGQTRTSAPPPRARRSQNLARRRTLPSAQIVHALPTCPHCGTALAGGSVKRTREVIEIASQPVVVSEHVFLERCCGVCQRRVTPPLPAGVVAGRSRLGVGLVSLIAVLREELRLPLAAIQRYLVSIHGLRLSVGGIVGALRQVERAGQVEYQHLLSTIRASPVIHADETGWREDGRNGYLWIFATPTACVYTHGGRGKGMVETTLTGAVGSVVSDFYAAYDHYPGMQQKCWAHLWRDIRDLQRQYPDDTSLHWWSAAVALIYRDAMGFTDPDESRRLAKSRQLQVRLQEVCAPFLRDATAPHAVLCRRIEKYRHALFTFVVDSAVPATNNAAERSLRHLVVGRKISGGTRSAAGTQTRVRLASLFATWRLRGLDPYLACRELLISPQT